MKLCVVNFCFDSLITCSSLFSFNSGGTMSELFWNIICLKNYDTIHPSDWFAAVSLSIAARVELIMSSAESGISVVWCGFISGTLSESGSVLLCSVATSTCLTLVLLLLLLLAPGGICVLVIVEGEDSDRLNMGGFGGWLLGESVSSHMLRLPGDTFRNWKKNIFRYVICVKQKKVSCISIFHVCIRVQLRLSVRVFFFSLL